MLTSAKLPVQADLIYAERRLKLTKICPKALKLRALGSDFAVPLCALCQPGNTQYLNTLAKQDYVECRYVGDFTELRHPDRTQVRSLFLHPVLVALCVFGHLEGIQ